MSESLSPSEKILSFWFMGVKDEVVIDRKQRPFCSWFAHDPQFDDEIRTLFQGTYDQLLQGTCGGWLDTPREALAYIILGDQFPRNLYRDSPQMYGSDTLALEAAILSRRKKYDAQLDLIERVFLYMPFMHAEDLACQNTSVELFSSLEEESKNFCPWNSSYYTYTLQYARRHHALIRQFGRFPHRNAILQRPSTPAQDEALKNKKSRF